MESKDSKIIMDSFFVYILKCNDGSYYVGHTDNLEQRIIEHNESRASIYTSLRLPVTLLWSELFQTRSEAFEAERKLKKWNREKKEIVIKYGWKALAGWKRKT